MLQKHTEVPLSFIILLTSFIFWPMPEFFNCLTLPSFTYYLFIYLFLFYFLFLTTGLMRYVLEVKIYYLINTVLKIFVLFSIT